MSRAGNQPAYSGAFGHRFHHKLTPQENEIIEVAFAAFSEEIKTNGEMRKFITVKKLKEAFENIDALGEIKDIQLLIDDVDLTGDGLIDAEEFRKVMTQKFLGEDDDSSFMHAFEILDENKDGYIPLVELRQILMREGQSPLSEQECDELLMFADLDADGLIDYRSFLRWLEREARGGETAGVPRKIM